MVARFDVQVNDWSPKGLKTVEVLQLDRREALASGYRKTLAHYGFQSVWQLRDQQLQKGAEQAFTPDAGVMHELKEPQVERQFLL